jgi:dihydroorotate dehydrogenase
LAGTRSGTSDERVDRTTRLTCAPVRLDWPGRSPVIVKIPPVRYRDIARDAHDQGVRWFHATNTLPVAKGGMSGAPLKPLAQAAVAWLRQELGEDIGIIGGGGIRNGADVRDFAAAGADCFGVGTYAMRPAALRHSPEWLGDILAAAREATRRSIPQVP